MVEYHQQFHKRPTWYTLFNISYPDHLTRYLSLLWDPFRRCKNRPVAFQISKSSLATGTSTTPGLTQRNRMARPMIQNECEITVFHNVSYLQSLYKKPCLRILIRKHEQPAPRVREHKTLRMWWQSWHCGTLVLQHETKPHTQKRKTGDAS